MIFTTSTVYQVGDKALMARNAATGEIFDPPQPVLITRICSRDEYRRYQMENNPLPFVENERIHGPVPLNNNFYEVTTD